MINQNELRTHLRAGGLHLMISALIGVLALGFIYFGWYPDLMAKAQGVGQLVIILIIVDMALGPLITTIIYKPRKRFLWLDLSIVAAIQAAALVYGVVSIHGGRPVYVVYSGGQFDVVAYSAVHKDSENIANAEYQISWFGPKWMGAKQPADPKKREEILFEALSGGPDLQHRPEYFVELGALREDMLTRLRPLNELRRLNRLDDAAWGSLLESYGREESEMGYLPLAANAKDGAVILDARTGEKLGVELLMPMWRSTQKPELAE